MGRLGGFSPGKEKGTARDPQHLRAQIDKRILIVLLLALLGGLGYLGWRKYLRSSADSQGGAQPDQAQVQDPKIDFRIAVQPADASLSLRHERLGLMIEQKTRGQALALDLEPGTYHASVSAEGFHPVQQAIEVSSSNRSWSVRLSERRGELVVISQPGVSVSTGGPDGKAVPLGETDAQGRLSSEALRPGEHVIELSLPDYRSERADISLTEDQPTELKRQLKPLPGRLKLEGRAGMEVCKAGQRLGQANEWIELPAGDHELELHCRGFQTEPLAITIAPNRPLVRQSPALVESTGPAAGNPWTLPDLGATFVHIAPGRFQMGSPEGDSDERPVHTVKISLGFWMCQHEVTQQQYQALMGDNPSKFEGSGHPVERVSWNDATAFCKKLTDQERQTGRLPEGLAYRLPTEAEWEYAARGGSQGRSTEYAGSDQVNDVAWCANNSTKTTHPVGQKRANELGLHDMSGNVWEWCQDWFSDYPDELQTDPVGAPTGMRRIIRGGSWDYNASVCRIGNRHYFTPTSRFTIIGFRMVLAAPLSK